MQTKLTCIRLKYKDTHQKRGTENVSSEIGGLTGIEGNVEWENFPKEKVKMSRIWKPKRCASWGWARERGSEESIPSRKNKMIHIRHRHVIFIFD